MGNQGFSVRAIVRRWASAHCPRDHVDEHRTFDEVLEHAVAHDARVDAIASGGEQKLVNLAGQSSPGALDLSVVAPC